MCNTCPYDTANLKSSPLVSRKTQDTTCLQCSAMEDKSVPFNNFFHTQFCTNKEVIIDGNATIQPPIQESNGGAIAGGIIGALIFLICIAAIIYFFIKRKQSEDEEDFNDFDPVNGASPGKGAANRTKRSESEKRMKDLEDLENIRKDLKAKGMSDQQIDEYIK